MRNETTVDAEARLDALLAGMPVRPREDFSRRVRAAIAEEMLDEKLAARPLAPSARFADRVISALEKTPRERSENGNALAFPRRGKSAGTLLGFARFAVAGTVAAVALGFGFVSLSGVASTRSAPLSEQVAVALESDPELARLAAADEEFSYGELVAASRLLTLLNENPAETAELFAYYYEN